MNSEDKVIDYYIKSKKLDSDVFKNEKNVFLESDIEIFHMISFGRSMLFIGRRDLINWAKENFKNTLAEEILDGENLYSIECKLREYNFHLAGEHLRFLYCKKDNINCSENILLKKITKEDMSEFYIKYPGFYNALNYEKDEMAIAAFIEGEIAAVAGADNYNEPLWQIGIDTVGEYRGQGLAKVLIQQLANEILKLDKIPYYTTWSANIASMRSALSVGFYPAFVEYFAEEY
ncbi:GNAT family N-acetyltransferase [Clostridium ihumii]|uniref:GNAT family N-acetyltransferase n=1 Tax=Clostridium ihumii TaxID=1470356 RepID=UPI003D344608